MKLELILQKRLLNSKYPYPESYRLIKLIYFKPNPLFGDF